MLSVLKRGCEGCARSQSIRLPARRRRSSRRYAALRGMARRRSPSSPIMLIQQSTYLPNCWNLVFGQKDGGRRSHRSKLEEWKPSDCTSRTNQHHGDVAPAESRAMIGRTHILSLSLSFPFSSIPSAPRSYARNPMASGAGGDWTHLGDCGTHRPPLCTPSSLLLPLSFPLSPSVPSTAPSLLHGCKSSLPSCRGSALQSN